MTKVNIGFLGCGNVGSGVYKIINENRDRIKMNDNLELNVSKILVRDINKKRNIDIERDKLTDNPMDIINDDSISVVAEFMGGVEPAREYILGALNNKKSVVTANKEVLARYWNEFNEAAKQNGVGLYYEATVAGGIPIIKVIHESLQANNIKEILGIINGTTNFILTKMEEEGKNFEDALSQAQRLGYAEPDPTADIEGYDAMYKLSILSSIAFNTRVCIDDIYREGITKIKSEDIHYGRELGYVLKLLAIAKKEGNIIEARVHPAFIPFKHPLASVRDSFNAIFIHGDSVGNLMLYGRGAGDMPTGSAIVSDIITACNRAGRHKYMVFEPHGDAAEQVRFNKDWETGFFVRLTVKDKPGVLACISGIFGKYSVSIESVIQKGHGDSGVPLIFVTHKASELSMKKAIKEIELIDDVVRMENLIRVHQ